MNIIKITIPKYPNSKSVILQLLNYICILQLYNVFDRIIGLFYHFTHTTVFYLI